MTAKEYRCMRDGPHDAHDIVRSWPGEWRCPGVKHHPDCTRHDANATACMRQIGDQAWEAIPMPEGEPTTSLPIAIRMQVGTQPLREIGRVSTADEVPALLRAAADYWERYGSADLPRTHRVVAPEGCQCGECAP